MKRKTQTPSEIVTQIKDGDRYALAKALTILESALDSDRLIAQQIIEECWNTNRTTQRIGITGPPGVGKSTFIDRFGMSALGNKHKIAVLTIDPSSTISQGSILGDKTRMDSLSHEEDVFIRPSPNQAILGGLQKRTSEAIILCESAGYDMIIIETVGVGQAEIDVRFLVDCMVLLLLPNSGDELQGIKRGIMENADFMIVHKADENKSDSVKIALEQLKTASHLSKAKESGWNTIISDISSLENRGFSSFYDDINKYFRHIKNNNFYTLNRNEQAYFQVHNHLIEMQKRHFKSINEQYSDFVKEELKNEKSSPLKIAADLFQKTIN